MTLDQIIAETEKLYDSVKAKPYTIEYWQRKADIDALRFIISCLKEYKESGECKHIHSNLCNLYVYDKSYKNIHRVGEWDHDSLSTIFDCVHYYNLQCGDGGDVEDKEDYGYVLLKSDAGYLTDEYGIIDKRFVPEIKAYLKENGYDISDLDDNGNCIRRDNDNEE